MNKNRCPGCNSENAGPEFPAKGIACSEGSFELIRCPDCGLGWTYPVLSDAKIAQWYPPAYYGKENFRFHWFLEFLVRLFRSRRARVIQKYTCPSRVLDVGCGRGTLLGCLKSFGYEPYGTEILEYAAQHARHRVKADIHIGDFLTAPYEPDSFEVVILWHTLEHLRKPFQALRHVQTLLKKGGLLVLAVPNSESLQARLAGANWFHLDIPRHYYHFGVGSIRAALSNNGFRIMQISHFSMEQNPYGWLQSIYNVLGFRFNLLYDCIKTTDARAKPMLRYPFQLIVMCLLLPLLLSLSLLLTLLEAAIRRGGTVEIYAVKT